MKTSKLLLYNFFFIVGLMPFFPFLSSGTISSLFQVNACLLALIAITWMELRPAGEEKFSPPAFSLLLPSVILLLFCLLTFILTISLWNKIYVLDALNQTFYFSLCFAFFYFGRVAFSSEENLKKLAITLWAVASLLSLYGIYQYFFGLDKLEEELRKKLLSPAELASYSGFLHPHRIFASFPTANLYAGFLILILPLGICLFPKPTPSFRYLFSRQAPFWSRMPAGKEDVHAVIFILSFILIFANLLLTFSAGAWLSLFLALLLGIYRLRKTEEKQIKKLLLTLVLVVFVAGIIFILLKRHSAFLEWTSHSSSVRLRFYNFISSIYYLSEYFLFGSGPGTFGSIYLHFRVPQAAEFRYAHNWLLQVFCEQGIAGFILITAFLWFILRKPPSWEGLEKEKKRFWLGVDISLFAFFFHNFFELSAYIPEIAGIFFCLAGAKYTALNQSSVLFVGTKGERKTLPSIFFPIFLLLTSLLISIAVFFIAFRIPLLFHLEKAYDLKIEEKYQPAETEYRLADKGFLTSAEAKSELALLLSKSALLASNKEDREKKMAEALELQKSACKIDPLNPFHYNLLAMLLWQSGDLNSSISAITTAIKLYPAKYEFYDSYAFLLERLGKNADAVSAKKKADEYRKLWLGKQEI